MVHVPMIIRGLTQRADIRLATGMRKLRLRGRGTIGIVKRGPVVLLLAHRVERAPVGLRRLLRIELKSRDISFFHAAPLSRI